MKSLSKLAALASGVMTVAVMAVSVAPAFAQSPGQLAGGTGLYLAKDLTSNGSYASSINVAACDEVKYSMQLSNVEFGDLTNVKVSATLPTNGGASKFTATTDLGGATGTSDSTTVNIPSGQTIGFESNSVQVFDGSGNLVKSVPGDITAGALNIGTVSGSTTEFVNFKAKVSCPTPPPVVSFACTALSVNQIDRTHYDFTATGSAQNATIQNFAFTAKDSNGKTVDTNTVNTSATSAVYHFNQSNAGTYTLSAVVGTDKGTSSNTNCVKQITVASVPSTPTPTPTPTPTTLPNTGPGDVAAELFAGTSALGAAGHYIVRRVRR